MSFCRGVKSYVTLSKICNIKVFENRAVFGSQEEVMHIYSIYPAKRWGCSILQHPNNKDHLTFIHFGNNMLEKLFSNHQKYLPHNSFGISDVIISLAVFQFKVREVNIQLALSHETNAAIRNITVMCVCTNHGWPCWKEIIRSVINTEIGVLQPHTLQTPTQLAIMLNQKQGQMWNTGPNICVLWYILNNFICAVNDSISMVV